MENIKDVMKSLISSCVAIYGFTPPSTQNMIDLICDEMSNFFLTQGFDHLSYDELYLAVQMNANPNLEIPAAIEATPVRAFGATVNVKFVADILCVYLQFRNFLDRKLKNFIDGF